MTYLDTLNQETDKLNNLIDSRKSKIEKLSVNTAGKAPEQMNTLSAEDLQYNVGEAFTHNIMRDENGNKFKWARTDDGGYQRDDKGNFIPEPFTGKTRNLYIDHTEDGNFKLGLAASDVNPEFKSPWTGESITPYEARYMNQTELGNPYLNDRKNLYDGTPGPKGVTPGNGKAIEVELPEDVANRTEYLVHSNKGQIANRAMGQGPKTPETEALFGSGQTEYTTPNAPLWNIDYDVSKAQVDGDTILPSQPKTLLSREEFAKLYQDTAISPASTMTEELLQLPGAAVSGAVGGIMDLADFGAELGQAGVNAVAGTKFKGGLFDKETIDNAKTFTGNLLGYGTRLDEQQHQEIKEKFDAGLKGVDILNPGTYNKIDLDKVAEGLWLGLQDPTTAAYSLGMMFGTAGMGGKAGRVVGSKLLTEGAKQASKVADEARDGIAAVKASTTMSAAEKAAEIAKYKSTITDTATAIKLGKDMSGPLSYGLSLTNEDLEQYRENNNGNDPSMGRLLGMTLANTVAVAAPDLVLTKAALGMNRTLNKALTDSLSSNIARAAAAITLSGMGEIPQGSVQAIVQNINQKWETEKHTGKSMKDIISDASADIIGQGLLEGVGGVHMSTPRAVGITAGSLDKSISDLRDKVYTKLGVDIPLGSTAKETGAVEPDQRTDYTKKIVEDTAELYFNPEKSFQAGYTDQSDEILTNAINRIMEVNELPEQTRDIVAGNLAREMYYKLNEAGSDGETRIPREEGVSRLQNMLSKFKGNEYVEAVVAQESRNELNREADNIVLRLENDGINVNNLDEVVKSLSKEELTNLNKALDNMKIMGSEELTNRANTIQNMLENKRTEVLGSEARDGVPPRKKTVAEVRAEIETLGFLTKNGMKKSLYDHDKDLLATVNNPLASETEKDSVLTSLRTFVNSRTSKLSPININSADGLVKARTPREIKHFAEINLEDNEKIAKVIEDALKRDHLVDTDRAELEGMRAVLKDNQKYLDSIANIELNTPSELKKFYDDLLGDLKKTEAIDKMIEADVIEMMENFEPVRNTPKENKSETVPAQAKPMSNLAKYRELSKRQVELVNELEKDGVSSDERAQIAKELAAVEKAMEELSPKKVAEESDTPEFDKLPEYKKGQKTMTYAGIGSRQTPPEVLAQMTEISRYLDSEGYKLQTGKTFNNKEEGADQAFSKGTSNKELFGPEQATTQTIEIAKEIHPAPQNLKPGGLKLMARNTFQVFGSGLDAPVDFVLFYAQETNSDRPKGGTGQAVEMARLKGIPTINMMDKDWKQQLDKVIDIEQKLKDLLDAYDTKVAEPKVEETPKDETTKDEEVLNRAPEAEVDAEYTEMSKEEYDAELARLGEELQSIESDYNTLKEWVDTGKAIKQEHKKAINEAKKTMEESGVKEELADIKAELRALRQTKNTIENTIGYINRLERKHEAALSKYKTAGNTIADMKKELDNINAQIEKQEKALEKNTSKALSGFSGKIIDRAKDLISKIIKSLDRLYKQLVIKEAKIEKKEREYDTLAKDIKQLEKDLSRVKDDLGKMESLESINAKIDVLQDKKDAVQEEMDKLRARLDNAKALREKALGDQALAGEALAEVQENAKYLSKQIKAYKDAMTKWFRAPMAKILEGSKAKVSTSQSRGISHRLLSGYDIMDIMPKIFTRTEEGKETVREAMKAFEKFESERSGTVIYQNIKDATDEHVLVKTGLDKLFSSEAMSDPIVKAKLIKAMNVSTAITLGEMVDVKTLSDDQLYDFVKGAFANILPAEPKDRNNAIYDLMNKVRQGKIVPLATFRSNAGKRLLKELEIKLDTDTIGDRDNVENALGALVIENMLGKYDKGNAKRVVNLAKGTVVYDYDTATVEVKSGNTKEEHKAEAGESTSSVGIMDLSEMTAEEVSEINKIATVLEYAGDKTDGRISLSPVKVEEGSKVRNSDVKKGKDVEEYLNKQGSMAWKFSEDFKSIWEDIAGKDLGKLTEIILGNKEEVLSKASPIELESLQAKYEADALDIERMMMAYNLVGTDTEFYIGWDYTVSNRNMMSNKMINPQNSKISRFIISAKGMRHKLTVSEDELVGIEHAIAQAFDLDPDKKDDASVKESLAEFGIRLSIKDGKYKLQIADGAKGAGLRKLTKDDKPVNPERIRNWFGVGTGHLMHAHQAIMLLKAINNNDSTIETNLALEADGITNGMASTALQMGLTDGTKGYYIKSGLYISGHNEIDGKEVKSHGEFKKAKGLDFYETPIEDFKYYLGKDAEFIETTINGKWRSFLKPLVMVLIYGAGIDNIVTSGSTDLVVKIINDGKNVDEVKKVFTDLMEEMKVDRKTKGIRYDSLNAAIERITQKSVKFNPDTGKAELVNDKNGKVYIDQDGLTQLATLMSLKVGEPLKLAFRDSFAPVKTYRSALKTVETMNYIIFQNEFNNKVKALGKETMSDLSEAELTKIKEELIAEGTYYGANNYFGETQDYFNSEKIKDPNNKVKVALTLPFARYNSSNIGSSRDIAGSLREIASNIGAIGVVDIHSVDGATMIEGHINDVLNIFDALIMGLDPIANKEQMEAINQAYIDINMNHSILGRAVEKLYKNRDKFVGITKLDSAQDILNDLTRAYELSDSGAAAILDQIGNISKQLDIMHRGRQDLRASDIDVKQYYIADALGGGKWRANTAIPEGSRPFIFSDKGSEAKKERDAIKSMLSKLEDLVINIPLQEALAGIKAGDGIISQQVSKEDAKLIDKLSKC